MAKCIDMIGRILRGFLNCRIQCTTTPHQHITLRFQSSTFNIGSCCLVQGKLPRHLAPTHTYQCRDTIMPQILSGYHLFEQSKRVGKAFSSSSVYRLQYGSDDASGKSSTSSRHEGISYRIQDASSFSNQSSVSSAALWSNTGGGCAPESRQDAGDDSDDWGYFVDFNSPSKSLSNHKRLPEGVFSSSK